MLFSGVLVDGSIREFCVSTLNLLRLPNEILEEVALVLGEEKVFGLLDYVAEIGDQCLTLSREFLGWIGNWLGLEKAVECDVDLLVLWTVYWLLCGKSSKDRQNLRMEPCQLGKL